MVVLALIAGIWAVVLVPPLLRDRAKHRAHSIGEFTSRLHALHRTNVIGEPRRPGAPMRPAMAAQPVRRVSPQTVRRRQEVLFVLGGAAVVSFLVAFKLGGFGLWLLHLGVDALIGLYFYALHRIATASSAPDVMAVRYPAPGRAAPEYAYRRSVNS